MIEIETYDDLDLKFDNDIIYHVRYSNHPIHEHQLYVIKDDVMIYQYLTDRRFKEVLLRRTGKHDKR